MRRALVAAVLVALGTAGVATAAPRSQDVVLPGPVPYPTQSPPLVGKTVAGGAFTRYVFHIASDQRVLVGVDESGSPVAVRDAQRLDVRGRGDYQFAIAGPIDDVRPGPGSESDPGLRADQVLWAGFSPGRKLLAANVSLRRAEAAQYLPLRLRLDRTGGGVTLELTNATTTPEVEYGGTVRAKQMVGLLDRTRRSARAGERLAAAYATFYGLVRQQARTAQIEAPLRVEGELRAGEGEPVRFSRTLGDGAPLTVRVHAKGDGKPHLSLTAVPVPVERLLRPPGGAPTWAAALRRRPLHPGSLLRRLLETRMRLVRSDQYATFLANPDADGRSRSVYVYRTVAAPQAAAAPAPAQNENGGGPLVLVLATVGAVLVAGLALVAWAHS